MIDKAMDSLPREVLSLILRQVSLVSLNNLARTSTTIRQLASKLGDDFWRARLVYPYLGKNPRQLAIHLEEGYISSLISRNYPSYTRYLFRYYPVRLLVCCGHNRNIVVDLDGLVGAVVAMLPNDEVYSRLSHLHARAFPLSYTVLFARNSQQYLYIREQHELALRASIGPSNGNWDLQCLATYQYNCGLRSKLILTFVTPSYRHLLDILDNPALTEEYLAMTNDRILPAITALKSIEGLVIPPNTLAVYQKYGYY